MGILVSFVFGTRIKTHYNQMSEAVAEVRLLTLKHSSVSYLRQHRIKSSCRS